MSKTPPKKTTTPQPTEAILTRNKSAQQGRQLRQKDRSMKAITQLLKSTSHKTSTTAGQLKKNTEKDKNVTVKKGSQKSSSTKKVLTADTNFSENKELQPNILKKKIPEKKITLKPKYEMKVIARTNKRKLNTPHKEPMPSATPIKTAIDGSSDDEEIYRPSGIDNLRAEMSIEDIIRLSEETDCLDDEDWMEILTCPSPVWWEDPPDESYVEEPIFMYIPTNNKKDADDSILNKPTETKRKTEKDDDTFDVVVKVNDTRILEKRSKLEKILGNIKNKLTTCKDKEIPNGSEIHKESDKSDKTTKEIINKNVGNDLNKVTINSEGSEYDVLLSDISINGEELLKELENMDIPIEGDTNNVDNNSDNKLSSENSNSIVKMKLIDKLNNETRLTDTDKDIARTTSQLEKNPLRRLNTELSNVSEDGSEIDSISDSNVQYLDDDESDIVIVDSNSQIDDKLDAKTKDLSIKDTQFFLDDDKKKLITVSTDTEAMTDFESYIDKSDFITVYKIMSQKYSDEENGANRDNTQPNTKENNNKNSSTVKRNDTKLNLFFKKRKSNNTKHSKRIVKKPKVDASSVCDSCKGNSFIPIPDSNKKLCLRCSSIYDESCTFCTTNDSEKKCTCEGKNKNSKVVYSCNVCEFIANTLLEARRHLKASHSNEIARRAWNKCFTLINND